MARVPRLEEEESSLPNIRGSGTTFPDPQPATRKRTGWPYSSPCGAGVPLTTLGGSARTGRKIKERPTSSPPSSLPPPLPHREAPRVGVGALARGSPQQAFSPGGTPPRGQISCPRPEAHDGPAGTSAHSILTETTGH